MDKIQQYILNIAVYVIMTGFVSIILPNNSFRKYMGLIIGIMLVRLVLEPFKKGIMLW